MHFTISFVVTDTCTVFFICTYFSPITKFLKVSMCNSTKVFVTINYTRKLNTSFLLYFLTKFIFGKQFLSSAVCICSHTHRKFNMKSILLTLLQNIHLYFILLNPFTFVLINNVLLFIDIKGSNDSFNYIGTRIEKSYFSFHQIVARAHITKQNIKFKFLSFST